MILVIGNKRFSSWSLRPWLLLKQFNIPFEEKMLTLYKPGSEHAIKQISPSAKVPVLIDSMNGSEQVIWDSLAIAEYLNDKFPEKKMWPEDIALRAHARSISAEMHSGFATMRQRMSHDVKNEFQNFDWSMAKKDVERIQEIWNDCLNKTKGPFLFGTFSIADAMFAPVVNRFYTYGIPRTGRIDEYCKMMRHLATHQEWIQAGQLEAQEF